MNQNVQYDMLSKTGIFNFVILCIGLVKPDCTKSDNFLLPFPLSVLLHSVEFIEVENLTLSLVYLSLTDDSQTDYMFCLCPF